MATKLTVLVPDDLHRRARAVAALKGDNISNIVREALAEYVAEALQQAEGVELNEAGAAPASDAPASDEIDAEYARQVSDFIQRYRPALQALAK